MTYRYKDKNISERLRKDETEDLVAYCKEQGFTPEETEIFVKNSLAKMFPEDDE